MGLTGTNPAWGRVVLHAVSHQSPHLEVAISCRGNTCRRTITIDGLMAGLKAESGDGSPKVRWVYQGVQLITAR